MRRDFEVVIEKINECMKDENIYSNKEMLKDFQTLFTVYAQLDDLIHQVYDTYTLDGGYVNIEECGGKATDELQRITECTYKLIENIERNDDLLWGMARCFDRLRKYYSDDMKLYKEMKSIIEKE